MSQEQQAKTSVIDILSRVLNDLYLKVEGISREFREAGLEDLVGVAKEFEEIMSDFRALVEQDHQYFRVSTSVWFSRRENKTYCDIRVQGHALEFRVDNVDPSTPISKVLDLVFTEKNILYAAARAFGTLQTLGYRIKRLAELHESLEKAFEMIENLRKVLDEIEKRCDYSA
jgi:Asp-tRNA(Asn)/Glu-tRNA(Gln) amidotransferase C subunit